MQEVPVVAHVELVEIEIEEMVKPANRRFTSERRYTNASKF